MSDTRETKHQGQRGLDISRRSALLAATALSAGGLGAAGLASAAAAQTPASKPKRAPFPLSQVRLKPSIFLDAVERNQVYLLSLEPDRLLHNFRTGAGLAPRGEIYGGWEAAGIAGHSLGHYHSALALMYAQTGKPEFKARALYVTQQLAECQAVHGDGYAGGTTVSRDGKTVDGKVVYEEIRAGKIDAANGLNGGWVPLYTYHKVMAGALDAHQACADAQSLKVAIGLGDYLGRMFEALNDDQVQQVLSVEHGGISESFAELYARTGNARWLQLSERVRHKAIIDPLSRGRDDLAGKHANTQIPKLIGLARGYEVGGDAEHAKTAMFFWETVVHDHSYVIGGNSEYEHFGPPLQLATRLGQQTCECCNSYNMLKLTRHLYGWSGEARYFDFYERAHLNHIMSQQDPQTGMFTYFSPLASGFARAHSTPTDSFWCCLGTGMENHSKHGDSIYWRNGNQVVVNLYYPSTLDWAEKGVKLDLDTGFPYQDLMTLTVSKAAKPVSVSLRIPVWCKTPQLSVNGKGVAVTATGGYVAVRLKAGDVVALRLPMTVYSESLAGDARVMACLNGPLVLAADLGPADAEWDGVDPVLIGDGAAVALVKSEGDQRFATAAASQPQDLKLRPYLEQHRNRTAVYFRRFTPDEWHVEEAKYVADAKDRADIRLRTVDVMRMGEQQPEVDHNFSGTPNTHDSGNLTVRTRVLNKGFIQFDLTTAPGPLTLQVSFDGTARNKAFDILIDGQLLVHETLEGAPAAAMNVRQYALPETLTRGKSRITVRFDMAANQWTAVFEARLFKAAGTTA